jgi:hypothetical protein
VNHFTLGQPDPAHRLDGNTVASNKKLGEPDDALPSIDNGGGYIRESRDRGKFRDGRRDTILALAIPRSRSATPCPIAGGVQCRNGRARRGRLFSNAQRAWRRETSAGSTLSRLMTATTPPRSSSKCAGSSNRSTYWRFSALSERRPPQRYNAISTTTKYRSSSGRVALPVSLIRSTIAGHPPGPSHRVIQGRTQNVFLRPTGATNDRNQQAGSHARRPPFVSETTESQRSAPGELDFRNLLY